MNKAASVDMTPPPVKCWVVVIDSPELPRKVTVEVDAMVITEAKVRGAEAALVVVDAAELSAKFKRRKAESQVAAVAKYAEATKK